MPKQKAVHTPVTIQSKTLISNLEVLIDSGMTKNFISPDIINHLSIPVQDLPDSRTIHNIDRTKNSIGKVTQIAHLRIHHQKRTNIYLFFIIDLGGDPMLLKMPFLTIYNSIINWTASKFKG